MVRHPFFSLYAALVGGISLMFGGHSLSHQIAVAEDVDNIAPDYYHGGRAAHMSNSGGARAHRRWKRNRAAGITTRKKRNNHY